MDVIALSRNNCLLACWCHLFIFIYDDTTMTTASVKVKVIMVITDR